MAPLGLRVWGHDVWTVPPNSQGYLTLAAAGIGERVAGDSLPDPDDPAWAHLLIEAARLAGSDRHAVLHEAADGSALLTDDRLDAVAARFDPERSRRLTDAYRGRRDDLPVRGRR